MTPRERIIGAIEHRQTDKLPHNVDLTYNEYLRMVEYTHDDHFLASLHNHIIGCGMWHFKPHERKRDHFVDDFGVVWNRTKDRDIGVVDGLLLPDPENNSYRFPTVDELSLRKHIEETIETGRSQGQFIVFNISFSMFERAWTLRGMENLLIDFIENPAFVHRLMSDICDYNLKAICIALSYDGIDGIMFGDDWGQQRGLIMGETYWREFIKPYVAKMYALAKSHGRYILQHSCGDIESIFEDLIEMGLDVYQTFQPEIYDIETVKAKVGDRLTFWGGISTQRLLPYADVETVRSETVRIMKIMGKNGGYIASPTHSIPPDVPAENVAAMLDVFLHQDKYL